MALLGNIRNVADRAIRAVAPNFVTPNPVIDDAASVIGNPGGVAFRRYAPALFDRGVRGLGQDVMRDAGRVNDMAQSGLSGLRSVGRRVGAAVMGGRQGLAELDRGRVNGMPTPVETLPPASRNRLGVTSPNFTSGMAAYRARQAAPGYVQPSTDTLADYPAGQGYGLKQKPLVKRGTGVFVGDGELDRDIYGGVSMPIPSRSQAEVNDIAARAVSDAGLTDDPGAARVALEHAIDPNRLGLGQVRINGRVYDQNAAGQAAEWNAGKRSVGSVTPQGGIITGATVGDMDRSSTPLSALPDARQRLGFGNMRMTGPTFTSKPSLQERMLGAQGRQAIELAGINNASAERVAGLTLGAQASQKNSDRLNALELQDRKNQGLRDSAGQPIYDEEGNIIGISGRGSLAKPEGTTAGDANIFKTTVAGIDTRRQELIRQRGIADSVRFKNADEKQAVADIDAEIKKLNDQEKALLEAGISPAPRAGMRAQGKAGQSRTANEGQRVLTPELAAQFTKQYGDARKAREAAKKAGYVIPIAG